MLEQQINRMLCPYGLRVFATKVNKASEQSTNEYGMIDEYDFYKLDITGRIKSGEKDSCVLEIALPKFHDRGMFTIDGVTRALAMHGYLDYTGKIGDKNYVIETKLKVLMKALNGILTRSLSDFFYAGQKPVLTGAQHLVDRWLKTSKDSQYVKDSKVAQRSVPEMIYLLNVNPGSTLEEKKYPDSLDGVVDPNSTSTSNNINRSYRIVKGCQIRGERLAKSNSLFCSAIQDNAIGIQYNPKRLHMLRPQFESTLELVHAEDPLVRPEDNQLHGVHLLTAIMNYKVGNYEDAIAFSYSASKKLRCIRTYKVNSSTNQNVTIHVKEGDVVSGTTTLMRYHDTKGKEKLVSCNKLTGTGKVSKMQRYNTLHYGVPSVRYKIEIEAKYDLMPGDKVTTRGAIKGVAVIVPDTQMPRTKDGDYVECMIAPASVYTRQSIVTFWEMMANEMAIETNKIIESQPFNEEVSFQELVDSGYGEKVALISPKGAPYKHKTFIGKLFIMRLDKLANEILSFQDGKPHLNEQGLPVDKASESGQRRDLAMGMNMEAKGLHINLEHMLKQTFGTGMITEISRAINNEQRHEGDTT